MLVKGEMCDSLCCGSHVKIQEEKEEETLKKKQSLFNRGLNYANPIIVINCWENSALIAPKQRAQLYTALMWILGNQLVHFHMKELILCVEGEMEEESLLLTTKKCCLFSKPAQKHTHTHTQTIETLLWTR